MAGEAALYLGDRIAKHSLLPRKIEQDTITVTVETLDDFLESTGDTHIDMVKIDVEGAELKVLRGGAATLSRPEPMILMVDIHGGRVKPHEVWSLLVEYGFSVRSPDDPEREIEPTGQLSEVLAIKA